MTREQQIRELNKQLYPTGRAWNYVRASEQVETQVDNFVDGIGNNFVDGESNFFVAISGSAASNSKRLVNAMLKSYVRLFDDIYSLLDQILPDNENFDETDAANWERVFGLLNKSLTLDQRKEAITQKLSYPNGIPERQHYSFIQEQLQAAGFDVYIQENRFPDGSGGWEVQDPDDNQPITYAVGNSVFGKAVFGGSQSGLAYSICANYIDESLDSTYFDNVSSNAEYGVMEYGVDQYETVLPLPREDQLRFTFFIGGASYPSTVQIPIERKKEFRELILKLKPAHTVAFLFINYV